MWGQVNPKYCLSIHMILVFPYFSFQASQKLQKKATHIAAALFLCFYIFFQSNPHNHD